MVAASSSSRALCSRAWWPQKRSSPPLGRTARTDAAAPHRSHLSAAVSAAGLARIPVMSSSHLRPPRTVAYVYLYSDALEPRSVPTEANVLQHIYLAAIKRSRPTPHRIGSPVRQTSNILSTTSSCHPMHRNRLEYARGERHGNSSRPPTPSRAGRDDRTGHLPGGPPGPSRYPIRSRARRDRRGSGGGPAGGLICGDPPNGDV